MASAAFEEPAEICKPLQHLLHLPSRSHLPTELEYFGSRVTCNVYIPTHDKTQAPPDQVIRTDVSTEAYIRLMRKKDTGAANGNTAGRKTPATAGKGPAGAGIKRSQPAPGSSDTPASKKAAVASSEAIPSSSKPASKPAAKTKATIPHERPKETPEEGTSKDKGITVGTSSAAAGAKTDSATKGSNKSSFFPSTAPPAAAALAAALQNQGSTKAMYEQDQLKAMPVKDLKEVCKARGLQVSGTKDQLIQRIVEYQRRKKLAQSKS